VKGAFAPIDRRGLWLLSIGHVASDLCQGAVPALLPFLAAERGYSYAALGALPLATSLGSSVIQPLSDSGPIVFAQRG